MDRTATYGDWYSSCNREATADKGSLRASGGIDQETTNPLPLLHLEGGANALGLHARKDLT
jgi:hypothetical protein